MRFVGSSVATTRSPPAIPVGSGGKRGPSTGVRVSSKRRRSPLKLTAEQLALVLTELEFRDQLLVFLDAGLGTRRGELGALRWMDCDFNNRAFDIQHSYYWRRGGHLIDTKSEASAQPLTLRSEEHTSELQSPDQLVCRLLLEKKKPRRDSR